MKTGKGAFKSTLKSKYVRSVSFPIICTFAGIAIAIVLLVYFSFSRDLRNKINANKYEELAAVESGITERLDEFDLIVTAIYESPNFLFSNLAADKKQSYNMSKEIENYLAGNRFIKYLIYYRKTNSDKFFSSEGEFSTQNFWNAYLKFDGIDYDAFMEEIGSTVRHKVLPVRRALYGRDYLTLIEPVPLYSQSRLAFAIAFVEKKALDSYMAPLFNDCGGELFMLDPDSNLLYRYEAGVSLSEGSISGIIGNRDISETAVIGCDEGRFLVQKIKSPYDKWQFIAVYDRHTLYSELHAMEAVMVVIVVLIMLAAGGLCFGLIVSKFRPINQLALSVVDDPQEAGTIIDEHGLLSSRFRKLYEEQRKMYSTIFFSNLLGNQYDSGLLEDAIEEYKIEFPGDTFCPLVIMGESGTEKRRFSDKLTETVWECLNTESITSYIYLNNSPHSIVVCMNGHSEAFSYNALAGLICSLHEQVLKERGVYLNVGIGSLTERLLDFPKCAEQAIGAALACIGNPDIFFAEYDLEETAEIPEAAARFVSRLGGSVKQNNLEEVEKYFDSLEDRKAAFIARPMLRNYMAYSSALMLLEYASESGEEEMLDKVFSELSSGHEDIDDIFGRLRDIAVKITEARIEKSDRGKKDSEPKHELLNRIRAVIAEKLCDSMLSLDVLADECGVSSSYLSRYFKQRMECTPMAYVENARMEIAKDLLKNTNLSLDEILERTGYIDKSNFIRKFRKREGVTPMSYRKTT